MRAQVCLASPSCLPSPSHTLMRRWLDVVLCRRGPVFSVRKRMWVVYQPDSSDLQAAADRGVSRHNHSDNEVEYYICIACLLKQRFQHKRLYIANVVGIAMPRLARGALAIIPNPGRVWILRLFCLPRARAFDDNVQWSRNSDTSAIAAERVFNSSFFHVRSFVWLLTRQ